MSGAYVASRVAAVIGQHGETMTLRRQTAATPQAFSDVTVKGKRYRQPGAGSDELVGGLAQNEIRVRIGNAEIAAAAWSGPPRKGDRLVIASHTYTLVADADTRVEAGVTVEHILLVKGA